MEIKDIYNHTKIKMAPPHFFNTSVAEHIKLVKSFQKKKEDRNLKSVFKDAERYAGEPQLDCSLNEKSSYYLRWPGSSGLLRSPEKSKKFYEKSLRRWEQPWVGKYVNQHWNWPRDRRY